jgi:hypothetical protein
MTTNTNADASTDIETIVAESQDGLRLLDEYVIYQDDTYAVVTNDDHNDLSDDESKAHNELACELLDDPLADCNTDLGVIILS